MPDERLKRIDWLKSQTHSTEVDLADAILEMATGRGVPGRFLENAEYVAILYEMKDLMQEQEALFAVRLVQDFCLQTGMTERELASLMLDLLQGCTLISALPYGETHQNLLVGLFVLLKNAASNANWPAARELIPTMLGAIQQGRETTLVDLIEYAVHAKADVLMSYGRTNHEKTNLCCGHCCSGNGNDEPMSQTFFDRVGVGAESLRQ